MLLLERILQDLGTRTSQEPPTKAFTQAPLRHGICSCKYLLERISPGSDLYRSMQGPLRAELSRISTRAVYARIDYENTADQELASPAAQILCEPAQSKCTWTCHKGHYVREFSSKMPQAKIKLTATRALCEPVQSKCTWTSHKSNFMREFTGKKLDNR